MDALHDDLTGLPNRALLVDRLTQALARARRAGTWVGVIHLELDGSAEVDGSTRVGAGQRSALPPAAAAAMVSEAAVRLVSSLRDTDTCARVDEATFVVVCEDLSHPGDGQLVEGRLRAALLRGVQLDGRRSGLLLRSGVAIGSVGSEPAALLETAAELAADGRAHDGDGAGAPAEALDIAAPAPVRGVGGTRPADG